jgi:SAM-dependent methyltransferase
VEKEEYQKLHELEDRLWWFAGMRAISLSLIERFVPHASPLAILDVGCGTGGMMPHLERFGTVVGVDLSDRALSFAKRREQGKLVQAGLPSLPFASESFDLLTSFDVIYHRSVVDDVEALSEMARLLRPGGKLLLRVPAYDWLRGRHDHAVHTRHRYGKRELREKLSRAGLEPSYLSHANCLLFPVAVAMRFAEGILNPKDGGSDVKEVSPLLNRLLTAVLRLEAAILRLWSLPFGLSLVAVAARRERQAMPFPE